jgi:hypothetical protein
LGRVRPRHWMMAIKIVPAMTVRAAISVTGDIV